MSATVDFLEGGGVDHAGRAVDEVLRMNDAELERRHDFIQWLFPLMEPSAAVPGSPVLGPPEVARIRQSQTAQRNLTEAAAMMADFYARTDHWLGASDHNHLRITRIIRSLRLLTGDAAADAFAAAIAARVQATGAPINARTRACWAAA